MPSELHAAASSQVSGEKRHHRKATQRPPPWRRDRKASSLSTESLLQCEAAGLRLHPALPRLARGTPGHHSGLVVLCGSPTRAQICGGTASATSAPGRPGCTLWGLAWHLFPGLRAGRVTEPTPWATESSERGRLGDGVEQLRDPLCPLAKAWGGGGSSRGTTRPEPPTPLPQQPKPASSEPLAPRTEGRAFISEPLRGKDLLAGSHAGEPQALQQSCRAGLKDSQRATGSAASPASRRSSTEHRARRRGPRSRSCFSPASLTPDHVPVLSSDPVQAVCPWFQMARRSGGAAVPPRLDALLLAPLPSTTALGRPPRAGTLLLEATLDLPGHTRRAEQPLQPSLRSSSGAPPSPLGPAPLL